MKTHYTVDEISRAGLIIEDSFDSEWVDFVLGRSLRAEPESVPVRLTLSRKDYNVRLDGELEIGFRFQCSRCASEASDRLTIPLQCAFVKEIEEEDSVDIDIWGVDANHEMVPYKGNTIALEQTIIELIVFALPQYPVCESDCKGLCTECGQNKNSELCSCTEDHVDLRWAKLKDIKLGG